MKKYYYYIYKITCLCGSFAGKYYIGQRQSIKPFEKDINYCGSGAKLWRYYKKYGKEEGVTYIKEFICYCNTWDELQVAEDFYVGDKYKDEYPECLNLKSGGLQCQYSEETIHKLSTSHLGQPAWNKGQRGRKLGKRDHCWTQEQKDRQSRKFFDKYENDPDYRNRVGCKKGSVSPMKGKKQSQEAIEKQRAKVLGTIKVNNGIIEKQIHKNEWPKYEANGFIIGRLYKPSEETKKKIGEKSKGRKHSEETKLKISNSNKGHGHPCNEDTRNHLKTVQKGTILMTNGVVKPIWVIPSKQQEYFNKGWFRCRKNGNPWIEKSA